MALERVPTDVVADDLVGVYTNGVRRLEAIVSAGLRRGLDPARVGGLAQERGDATLAYRERQLRAAHAVLDELAAGARRHAPLAVGRAYQSAIFAVDRTALGHRAALESRFGGIHQRAVEVLAGNMTRSLERVVARTGDNLEAVFARASELEGGLPARARRGPLRRGRGAFIGRRVDDPWRRVALDEIAGGLVTLSTRRQVTAAMVDRLIREGVADALTGYVDSAGRRWSLDRYAAMATRTTTREATSRAAVNRMTEHGLDLVTISSHPHAADECDAYDGQTFSLSGDTAGYEVLDTLPPFHPNCLHVVTPAEANLDDYERELGLAASIPNTPAARPATPAPRARAPRAPRPPRATPAPASTPAPPAPAAARPMHGSAADTFDVPAGIAGERARRALGAAAQAIDGVHRLPADMPRIPFGGGRVPRGAEGAYARQQPLHGGGAIGINVAAGSEVSVAVHEIGHFLDHKGLFGDLRDMATETRPELKPFLAALESTGPVKRLRDGLATGRLRMPEGDVVPLTSKTRGLVEYLLRPRELFARSYEQWVLRRAGIASKRHRDGVGLEYWSDEDYPVIERELERLFRERGLIE